ncbi:MAG: tetratricopeptide repeat protein [Acidobacteriota bacterium]
MRDRMTLLTSAAFVLAFALSSLPAIAQTGRIGGIVKDDKGQPIKGATIVAENPSASPSSFTATTDDRGRFSIIGLRAGNWKITASAPGFQPSSGSLPVKTIGAPNPPLEFTLVPGAAGPAGALAGVNAKELQGELEKAEQLLASQQFDAAIAAYRAILEKAPMLSMIHMQIAVVQRRQKDYDGALASYQKVLEADPGNERAKIEIGMTNLEKGDLDAAEKSLAEAAQSMSASREVFYNLGEVKFAKGETDAAMAAYQRAIDTDPNWAKPYFKLGLGHLQKANIEEAIKTMEKVIAVEPNSQEAGQAKALIEQLKKQP